MKPEAKKLLDEVLKLPADARAEMAGQLLRSLDDEEDLSEEEYDAAWGTEIAHRLQEVDEGTVKTLTHEEALRFIASDDPADDR